MRHVIIAFGLVVVCAADCSLRAQERSTAMSRTEKIPEVCDAPKGILCMAKEVAAPDSGLDHTDALGYSGAAFRIHTLPREVLCPSTVSPRFGYKPPAVDRHSYDVVSALRQAKMLAETGQFGEYLSGATAYDLWIQLLEADDESEMMHLQVRVHAVEDAGLPILNTYCYLALVHARESAGPFLSRRASELNGAAGQRVEEAAACYERVVMTLKAIDKPAWNSESRQKQADAMRDAKDIEKQAAALLGEALADLASSKNTRNP